jgi:hypothetical protein
LPTCRAVEWDTPSAALGAQPTPELLALYEASARYRAGDLAPARKLWKSRLSRPGPAGGWDAETVQELAMFAEALAGAGDEEAVALVERLRAVRPAEADAILALLRFRQGDLSAASGLLARAFAACRDDPWPSPGLMTHALDLAPALAERDRGSGTLLFESLTPRFSVANLEAARQLVAVQVAIAVDRLTPRSTPEHPGPAPLCARAFAALEPWPPWNRRTLTQRAACYRRANDPRAARAEKDLREYLGNATTPIFADLGDDG